MGLVRAVYSGSADGVLVLSAEQALPLKPEWLNFTRLQLRAERTVALGPLRITASGKGGGIFGDLPPYEAFPIGGTNSVRGCGLLPASLNSYPSALSLPLAPVVYDVCVHVIAQPAVMALFSVHVISAISTGMTRGRWGAAGTISSAR